MPNFSNSDGLSDVSSLVESEALAWIAQLNGDHVSEKDLAAFREWVNRSPAHQKEIRELSALWGDLNSLTVMDEPIRQADLVSKRLRKRQARKHWKKWLVGPALVGAAAMSFFILSPVQTSVEADTTLAQRVVNVPLVFITSKGEQQVHSFEDGSVITLNTDSHIEVDFTAEQRDVRLLKGEALFSVAHDKERPFLVFANDGIVRAVGTEFSVHLTKDAIDVLVSEGSVELSTLKPTLPTLDTTKSSSGNAKVASLGIIKAGHTARVRESKASISLVSEDAIDAKLSWRAGWLDLNGKPLEQAIAEFTRYTDLNIIISDPEIKDRRLGGTVRTGEPDQLFKALKSQFGITAEYADSSTVYLKKPQ